MKQAQTLTQHSFTRTKPIREILQTNPNDVFHILERIGHSPSGPIYKAKNLITEELFAVKIATLRAETNLDFDQIDFVLSLEHSFIVKTYDIYLYNEELWMVIEYCQLGSIADSLILTKKALEEEEVAAICYNILLALEYLHAKKRVHGRVKTSNILINHWGHVKLADFGIQALKQSENYSLTDTTFAGQSLPQRNFTPKDDIWALGICILEMAEIQGLDQDRKKTPMLCEPELFSENFKDFLGLCLKIDANERATASGLLKHPLIQAHKSNFAGIRKGLYSSRIRYIESSRSKSTADGNGKTLSHGNTLEDLMASKENINFEDLISFISFERTAAAFQVLPNFSREENNESKTENQKNSIHPALPPLRKTIDNYETKPYQNESRGSRTSILRDLSNTLDLEYSGFIADTDSLQMKKRFTKFQKQVNELESINDENSCPQFTKTDTFITNKTYESEQSREFLMKKLKDQLESYELGSMSRREKEALTPKECEFVKPLPFTVRNIPEQSTASETLTQQQRSYRKINLSNFVVKRHRQLSPESIDECNVPESDAEEELTFQVDDPSQDSSPRREIANLVVQKLSEHETALETARSNADVAVDTSERITAPLVFKPPKNFNELLFKTASFMHSKDRSVVDLLHESRDQGREINSFTLDNTQKDSRFNQNSTFVMADLDVTEKMSERKKLEMEMDTEIIKLLLRYKAKFDSFDKQKELNKC